MDSDHHSPNSDIQCGIGIQTVYTADCGQVVGQSQHWAVWDKDAQSLTFTGTVYISREWPEYSGWANIFSVSLHLFKKLNVYDVSKDKTIVLKFNIYTKIFSISY